MGRGIRGFCIVRDIELISLKVVQRRAQGGKLRHKVAAKAAMGRSCCMCCGDLDFDTSSFSLLPLLSSNTTELNISEVSVLIRGLHLWRCR